MICHVYLSTGGSTADCEVQGFRLNPVGCVPLRTACNPQLNTLERLPAGRDGIVIPRVGMERRKSVEIGKVETLSSEQLEFESQEFILHARREQCLT